jgi:hypothetical protein
MDKRLTDVLERPAVRITCACVLAYAPRATRLLRLVKSPAQEAFIAFVEAVKSAGHDGATQCRGWTVHELTAHVAAGSAEIADLIELELAGAATRPTRDFEEREAPYRMLSPRRLRRSFFEEALRATVAVERLRQAGRDRRVAFTGTHLDASTLTTHIESELVLHRWDIVGCDEIAIKALGDMRLAVHAVTTVADMKPNVFPARAGGYETVVLRAAGAPDIAVTSGSTTSVELAPPDHSHPVVECHPATRTLMLWGRFPASGLPKPTGAPETVSAVIAMLSPDDARHVSIPDGARRNQRLGVVDADGELAEVD